MSVRRASTTAPRTPPPAAAPPAKKPSQAPAQHASSLEPAAPRQLVTLGEPQPRQREDVYLTGSGPGWADPAAADADRSPPVRLYTSPLFKDGVSPSDVQQGQLGDCYVCAALAGLAASQPDAIKRLIQPDGAAGANVTFYERDVVTGQFQPVVIHVDAELYQSRYGGGALYGHAPGDPASMELWFPLVEKAYATWRGGYETVGRGGVQNQVFEAVLGRPAGWLAVDGNTDREGVWNTIQATLNAGLPIGAATHSVDDGRYANTGVHANHGYSLLRTETDGAERYVVLRNPWGEGEPRGDGVDDGVFRVKLDDFMKLYGQLQFTLV